MGLSSAILRKDAEMVAGLIQLGADVNAIDKNGRTPLMIAASIGNAEIVQMLLAAGAKLEYVNQAGETALSVARSKDVEKLLRRAFVVSRFISLHKPESKSNPPEEPVLEPAPNQAEPVVEPAIQPVEEVEPEGATPHATEEQIINAPADPLPAPPPLPDFDATQPISTNKKDIQEVNLVKSEEIQDSEIPNADELGVEHPAQLATQEDVIEETLLISPFLIHEMVEESKIESQEIINEEIEPCSVEVKQAEEAFQKPVELERIQEEPSLEFDHPLGTIETAAWENRAPAYESSVSKALLESEQTGETSYTEEPQVEMEAEVLGLDFDEPLAHTDISAWENRVVYHPAEKMYQEEVLEEVKSAEPQAQEEFTFPEEVTLTEEVAFAEAANEEELIDDIPAMREPFIGVPFDEFEEEQIAALSNSADVEIDRLPDEFIQSVNEQPLAFQLSNEENVDASESPRYEHSSAQFQTNMDGDDSSWNFNTAQQLRSKFQDYEEWFELHQSSQEDFLLQEVSDTSEPDEIVEPVQHESQSVPEVTCLECGEVIGPNELRCSKCHTTIVRRYCAGCSELIPDHAIFCPYCGTYVTEHFHFAKKARERYVLGATVGLCILILLMVLTWPRTAKPKGYQASHNLKPAHEITKSQHQKNSPIVFVAPEKAQEKKVESRNKSKVQQPAQKPVVTKLAANTKRAPETPKQLPVDTKQPAAIKSEMKKQTASATPLKEKVKPVSSRASLDRSSDNPSDVEKIKLGRSLNSRGYSLINQGKPGEAIPLLEQSLRSFPKGSKDEHYAYALFNLGVAWRMAGRPDIAIPILEKRIKINNQRDVVARELSTARKQAQDAGFGSFQK
jgi:tetratricopeptide (TPR) repeat protein